jgi:hypothetical protein
MSDVESFDAPVDEPINLEESVTAPRKRRWVKWTVGGVLIALFFGYQAFAARPEVRLYRAITNWASLVDSDTTLSAVVTPELFSTAGVTDAQIAAGGLPGVKTVADAITALNSMNVRLQGHRGSEGVDDNSWLSLGYGGQSLLQFGIVDRAIYSQISLANLSAATPQIVTQAQIDEALQQFRAVQSLGFSFIGDMIDGKMIKVSLAEGTPLGTLYENVASAQNSSNDSLTSKLQSTLVNGLREASTISGDGSEGNMDKFIITIDGTKFANVTSDSFFSALAGLGQGEDVAAGYKQALQGKIFKLRVWLEGDTLKGMDFDLISFAKSLNPSNAKISKTPEWASYLRMEMGDKKIVTPTDAIDVTDEITQLLGSAAN